MLGGWAPGGLAQPAPGANAAPGDALIELNFPADVELRVVVDYAARRLGWNILYDEQINNKKISLAAPARISADALPALLESILRAKGFTLVDADAAGWKRVAPAGEPAGPVGVRMVPARHADAADVAGQVNRLLAARQNVGGAAAGVDISHDARTNQVVVIGPPSNTADVLKLIEMVDVPASKEDSPVRFYKLANTTAADVLDTIRSLEGEDAGGGASGAGSGGSRPLPPTRTRSPEGSLDGPAGATGRPGGTRVPFTSAAESMALPAEPSGGALGQSTLGQSTFGQSPFGQSTFGPATRPSARGAASPDPSRRGALTGGAATVTADANTNTIIVVGPPAVQRVYEQLIRQLDRRRPQVLIESTVVSVDTSRGFRLGVEVAARAGSDDSTRLISFSSFGLSEVDADTGRLSLTPGLGFNGAVLNADVADVVLRALSTHSRSRIVAAPRVLVNDNATGTLFSIAESPFTSVNAGNTIATTSFAGYAEAGTEITLTPHISEDDYLQLQYVVSLSSFTGQGGEGIPPPRQTDKVASEVTIPDGATIVVGGLNRRQSRQSNSAVPLLGEIPVVGNLFRSRTSDSSNTTLFVFIRPIILRDDQFEDLKFLSGRDARAAELPDGFPGSEPLSIR